MTSESPKEANTMMKEVLTLDDDLDRSRRDLGLSEKCWFVRGRTERLFLMRWDPMVGNGE